MTKYPDVLVSWPDSRAFGRAPGQFGETCRELIANGFRPCVFLTSKVYDPTDLPGLLRNITPVLPYLVNVVPREHSERAGVVGELAEDDSRD